MKKTLLVLALTLTAAACATLPAGAPPAAGPSIPAGALELGNWQSASASQTLTQFSGNVERRYRPGLQIAAVSADLRRNEFNCADNNDNVRGDPPAAICRRTQTTNGCTHTWQVHLFDESDSAVLARTRGLYDRRCGNDGLLGGPG